MDKQEVLMKLAQARLAVNYVLRQRMMKQAEMSPVMKGGLLGAGPKLAYDWWNRQSPRFRGTVAGGAVGAGPVMTNNRANAPVSVPSNPKAPVNPNQNTVGK